MGESSEVAADGPELVMAPVGHSARPAWRFVREDRDRWRGTAGMNTGEVLTVWRWGLHRLTALAVAANGLTAAAGGIRGQVVIWDLE